MKLLFLFQLVLIFHVTWLAVGSEIFKWNYATLRRIYTYDSSIYYMIFITQFLKSNLNYIEHQGQVPPWLCASKLDKNV